MRRKKRIPVPKNPPAAPDGLVELVVQEPYGKERMRTAFTILVACVPRAGDWIVYPLRRGAAIAMGRVSEVSWEFGTRGKWYERPRVIVK